MNTAQPKYSSTVEAWIRSDDPDRDSILLANLRNITSADLIKDLHERGELLLRFDTAHGTHAWNLSSINDGVAGWLIDEAMEWFINSTDWDRPEGLLPADGEIKTRLWVPGMERDGQHNMTLILSTAAAVDMVHSIEQIVDATTANAAA